jgi:hypothetical protein
MSSSWVPELLGESAVALLSAFWFCESPRRHEELSSLRRLWLLATTGLMGADEKVADVGGAEDGALVAAEPAQAAGRAGIWSWTETWVMAVQRVGCVEKKLPFSPI